MTYIQTHICDSTKFIQDTINIYMASLTTNIEENTTPETTTIVSYRRNYIKNLNKLRTILHTCPIQHFVIIIIIKLVKN